MGAKPCPICKLNASIEQPYNVLAYEIECERCGRFGISDILLLVLGQGQGDLSPADRSLLPYLSAHTKQATTQGVIVMLDTDNWREYARTHTRTPVSQKVRKLLELLADRSTYPGEVAKISAEVDYPLLDAKSVEEFKYFFEHLGKLEYIEEVQLSHPEAAKGLLGCVVTVEGWKRLEPPAGGGIPGRCFIAMSFDASLNEAYQLGIHAAVRDCGFDPIRIDLEQHNEKICDKILAEIRMAQFIVADFTRQRAGVYFEAGFAMGLGRPVVWTCHEDELEKTHFDTRQYNHVKWSNPQDLRVKLADRIRATISG